MHTAEVPLSQPRKYTAEAADAALATPDKSEHSTGLVSPLSPWGTERVGGFSRAPGADATAEHLFIASASTSMSSEGTTLPLEFSLPASLLPDTGPAMALDGFHPLWQRVAQDVWSDTAASSRKSMLSPAASLQAPSEHDYEPFPSLRPDPCLWGSKVTSDATSAMHGPMAYPAPTSTLSRSSFGLQRPAVQHSLVTLTGDNYSPFAGTASSSAAAVAAAAALSGTSSSGSSYLQGMLGPHATSLARSHTAPLGLTHDQFSGLGAHLGSLSATSSAAQAPGLTAALAQVAAERGLDQEALAMLLQNPMVLNMLSAGSAGSAQHVLQAYQAQAHVTSLLQQQQQQQQAGHQRLPASQQPLQPFQQRRPSEGGRRGTASTGQSNLAPAAAGQPHVGALPAQLPAHVVAELASTRNVLSQLLLSAFAFLHSDSMRGFFDSLSSISQVYASMHDLPVVRKRQCCAEMLGLRDTLLQDVGFAQILNAVCALRQHMYSLSRKVLLLSQQGSDAVPIDLLLGSMSAELFHLLRPLGVLPQEVLEFFCNGLPHPKLAILVFVEFTHVDPLPAT